MAGIQFLTQVGQICTDVRQVRHLRSFPVYSYTNICRNSSSSQT
jgi:hypothetical protein